MSKKVRWVIFVALYWATLHALSGFRSDHLTIGLVILALALLEPITTRLFRFLLPLLLTGIIYDSQRFYADYIRGPIHVTEPYAFDKYFLGIPTAQGILTPNEFWQLHTHPALDFVTGFAYLTFFAIFILQSAYYYFWLGRESDTIRRMASRMTWAFFWLNLIGYSTYYWYAAAPPWYVAMYGLGPARLDVQANAAGCLRFDAMLGTHFFTGMYGRAADVFGAIPSLHVAYPFLALIYSFRFRRLRAFSVGFYALMCFSAVYLNHHYVLDIIWGSAYAALCAWAAERFFANRGERKAV
jgi:membrane-associated phospholipid phosphatase